MEIYKTMCSFVDFISIHLLQPFEKNFLETVLSILATAIVLFFTLVLIPIQQFVNRYSPSLLNYFKKDRLTISLMVILLGSFFYHIVLLFTLPTYLNAYISAFLPALSFLLIVLMIFRVIKMMNPSEYLFPRIQKDCSKILKELKPMKLQNPIDKLSQLEDQMQQVMISGEKVDPNEEKWSVSKESIDETEYESFLLFSSFLKRQGYDSIAEQIHCKLERLKEDRERSIAPLYFVNHIKRPITTFDSNLFSQFDKEIFGNFMDERT